MKYSIRGNICCSDGSDIVTVINHYSLWRLLTSRGVNENAQEVFTFEAWVNTEGEKTALFNDLKGFVHEGDVIDWHECTHDETVSQPCVIAEEYRG